MSVGSVPPRQASAAITTFPPVPRCTLTSVTKEVRYGEFVGLGSGLSTVFHDDVRSSAGRFQCPPLSVDFHAPPAAGPAYRALPSAASAVILPPTSRAPPLELDQVGSR